MEYAEFMELVEKCAQVANRKPAFWFEVRVMFPEEVIEQIKQLPEVDKRVFRSLKELAKNLAKTKIAKLFEKQRLFYDPCKIHVEKITLTEPVYLVSLIYCWG